MCRTFNAKKGRFIRLCARTKHRGARLYIPWDDVTPDREHYGNGNHVTIGTISRWWSQQPIPVYTGARCEQSGWNETSEQWESRIVYEWRGVGFGWVPVDHLADIVGRTTNGE